MATLLIVITAVFGLYMAWNIGANDVANSMADAVGSRAISLKWAIVGAGLCEFAGAVLVGSHVTDTVRKGIVAPQALAGQPEVFALGMACALLAAALWLNCSSWMGMPVSTTHSIVGAVVGFGVISAGIGAVDWAKMGQIVASWFISPVAGAAMAYLFFIIIARLILGRENPARAAPVIAPFIAFFASMVVCLATVYKGLTHIISRGAEWLTGEVAIGLSVVVSLIVALVTHVLIKRFLEGKQDEAMHTQLRSVEKCFAPMVVVTSCSVAFAHGSNDVANAIGPLAAVVDVAGTGFETIHMQVDVPLWVLTLGGIGIFIGLATFGHRVMMTVGRKITQITPSRGVAADVAATTTVLVCSRLKLPVSTTHTLVGAILGVGLARGLGAVNRRVLRNIFGSWLLTVPAAALLSIILYTISSHFLLT